MTGGSDEIENLLRDVERSVSSGPATSPADQPAHPPATRSHDGSGALPVAATSAALSAGLIFLLFAALPILGAVSGAAGAFIAVFFTVLIGRLRRR